MRDLPKVRMAARNWDWGVGGAKKRDVAWSPQGGETLLGLRSWEKVEM